MSRGKIVNIQPDPSLKRKRIRDQRKAVTGYTCQGCQSHYKEQKHAIQCQRWHLGEF